MQLCILQLRYKETQCAGGGGGVKTDRGKLLPLLLVKKLWVYNLFRLPRADHGKVSFEQTNIF